MTGFHEKGSITQFRPAVHYYFSKEQKGFFVGPSFKYTRFAEKNNLNIYDDTIYSIGLALGLKSHFKENFSFIISTAPHYAVGASTNPGKIALGSIEGLGFNIGLGYRF